jgi:diguanylate cyclase
MLTSSTWLWFLGISALQVAGGVVFGWWLGSVRRSDPDLNHIALSRRLADALARVQQLAGNVSSGAVTHRREVEAVQQNLSRASQGDAGELQQAMAAGLAQILHSNERLHEQLNDVETKLEEQSRQIETQLAEARIDSLTGAANRRAFDEEVARRLAEWRRRHVPMSLLMIDVDHFKKINDRHGHPVGDFVLRELARVLQHTMREMDFTARYGGEEFAIVLPGTTLRDARRAAQRALQAVSAHTFEHNGEELKVTISVGLAEVMPSDNAETLVRRADEALYLSKAAGRNCGHFHSGTDFLALESPRLIDTVAALRTDPLATMEPPPPSTVAESHDAPKSNGAAKSSTSTRPGSDAESGRDPLTNLPGAQAFSAELRRRVQRARSEHRPLTLLLVDIDRLAEINRRDGRPAGDAVICRLAKVLTETARAGDYAARYHEGQFALALDGIDRDAAVQTAEAIRRTMQTSTVEIDDLSIEATISCGIATAEPGDRSVSLVMRASTALTAAKSSGRDCAFVHDGRNVEPADEIAAS